MAIKNFIIILCSFVNLVTPNELSCNFIQHLDGYNCELGNSFKDKITSVKGRHVANKTNADIEVLFATLKSNISEFPSDACMHFTNLLIFDINGPYMTSLSRSIFRGCIRIQQVKISYTKIKEFDENLFFDLTSLEILRINENSLEHLPRDLLKFNTHLRTLDLSYNKLTSISTIFPSSLSIIKVMNNPCADRIFYSRDFEKLHELCPDENKRLSLNLTDTMVKFQDLHLLIMKTSAKLNDFESIADSALNELDERLNIIEIQQNTTVDKSVDLDRETDENIKAITTLKFDLKNLESKIEKQRREILSIKEDQSSNFDKIKEQISKLQQDLNNSLDNNRKFDRMMEGIAVESNFGTERKFIYLGFAMNLFMLAGFMLFIFVRMYRPVKRDAMLLNPFES